MLPHCSSGFVQKVVPKQQQCPVQVFSISFKARVKNNTWQRWKKGSLVWVLSLQLTTLVLYSQKKHCQSTKLRISPVTPCADLPTRIFSSPMSYSWCKIHKLLPAADYTTLTVLPPPHFPWMKLSWLLLDLHQGFTAFCSHASVVFKVCVSFKYQLKKKSKT